MKNKIYILIVFSFIFAQYDWTDDGVSVRQGIHIEWQRTGDNGNDGEMIFAWSDTRYGGRDIYAQKVDVNGNPLKWAASSNGYQFIEAARGTTVHDSNFITVIPGAENTGNSCSEVRVIPNPYFGRSHLNEVEYMRRIAFMDLPEKYTLKIYTVSGEFVWSQNETYENGEFSAQDGSTFWYLRSINNTSKIPEC